MNNTTKTAIEAILKNDSSISEDQRAAVSLALETSPDQNAVAEIGGVILPGDEDDFKRRWGAAFAFAAERRCAKTSMAEDAVAIFKAIPVGMPFVRNDDLSSLLREKGIKIPEGKRDKWWMQDRLRVLIRAGLLRELGLTGHSRILVKESDVEDEDTKKKIEDAAGKVDGVRHKDRSHKKRRDVVSTQTPDCVTV